MSFDYISYSQNMLGYITSINDGTLLASITGQNETTTQLSDLEMEIKLKQDERLALVHEAQEVIGDPELLLQCHQRDIQLDQELKSLEMEYNALKSQTNSSFNYQGSGIVDDYVNRYANMLGSGNLVSEETLAEIQAQQEQALQQQESMMQQFMAMFGLSTDTTDTTEAEETDTTETTETNPFASMMQMFTGLFGGGTSTETTTQTNPFAAMMQMMMGMFS